MTEPDNNEYTLTSNFYRTATVADIELSITPEGLGRKVLRAEVVDNPKVASDSVKACVVHQRRRTTSDAWADLPGPSLQNTTYKEPSKFPLDSAETTKLFGHLADLYQVGPDQIKRGRVTVRLHNEDEIIQTDSARAALIRRLLDAEHGEEVWHVLIELQPDLANKLAVALRHSQRQSAVDEFTAMLGQTLTEDTWKAFLREHCWMFGASNVSLIDESRLDIKNIADLPFKVDGGFLDLVELKRPDTPFWMKTKSKDAIYLYRGKYPIPHYELNGAMAQVSSYILQAEKHVSDTDFRKTHGVTPLKPRGLVVHGRSHDWGEVEWEAFRLLNDTLHGVQVMTFDHLLAQAKRAIDL